MFPKPPCRLDAAQLAIEVGRAYVSILPQPSIQPCSVFKTPATRTYDFLKLTLPDKGTSKLTSCPLALELSPLFAFLLAKSRQASCLRMSSSSGLTRRRGAAAASSNNDADESNRVNSPLPRRNDDGRGPETSYENSENGHKIAFDPRDISENAERTKQPKLTLMEEVLLMGLKDKQGYLSFWNDNISYALRGCIVMELAFRGRISMQNDSSRRRFPLQDRMIEVIDDTLTGEVLLDEALKMMKSSEKMSVASWIDLMSGMLPVHCGLYSRILTIK